MIYKAVQPWHAGHGKKQSKMGKQCEVVTQHSLVPPVTCLQHGPASPVSRGLAGFCWRVRQACSMTVRCKIKQAQAMQIWCLTISKNRVWKKKECIFIVVGGVAFALTWSDRKWMGLATHCSTMLWASQFMALCQSNLPNLWCVE